GSSPFSHPNTTSSNELKQFRYSQQRRNRAGPLIFPPPLLVHAWAAIQRYVYHGHTASQRGCIAVHDVHLTCQFASLPAPLQASRGWKTQCWGSEKMTS